MSSTKVSLYFLFIQLDVEKHYGPNVFVRVILTIGVLLRMELDNYIAQASESLEACELEEL